MASLLFRLDRVNHLNPVPLREWYERWVQPMADVGIAEHGDFRPYATAIEKLANR